MSFRRSCRFLSKQWLKCNLVLSHKWGVTKLTVLSSECRLLLNFCFFLVCLFFSVPLQSWTSFNFWVWAGVFSRISVKPELTFCWLNGIARLLVALSRPLPAMSDRYSFLTRLKEFQLKLLGHLMVTFFFPFQFSCFAIESLI